MKKQILHKRKRQVRRAHRTRSRIRGTQERPRVSVFRSSKHISAQIIDDTSGKTIASASDKGIDNKLKPMEVAAIVGAELAKKATAAGVKQVVFDRGPYLYHGRVKALAEGARKEGLEF